jgi:hypothetical protein
MIYAYSFVWQTRRGQLSIIRNMTFFVGGGPPFYFPRGVNHPTSATATPPHPVHEAGLSHGTLGVKVRRRSDPPTPRQLQRPLKLSSVAA